MLESVILFGIGLCIGAMNAIAGGGGLVGFSALIAIGLSPLVANATAIVASMTSLITSAFGYRKYLRSVPKLYALLLIPCIIGAAFGAYILRRTSGEDFEKLVPVLILIAVGLFAFQPLLHFHVRRTLRANSLSPLIIVGLALIPLTIYGGYFGPGFGFILLAFLSFTRLHDIHQMNALKNIAGAFICIAALLVLAPGEFINWPAGLAMAIGSGLGGYGGSRIAQRISSHFIRIFVIIIGVSTAAYIGLHRF